MKVQKFSLSDANLIKSPGQEGDIYVGNLVDETNGGPVTIGYVKYGPGQTLTETMAVDDGRAPFGFNARRNRHRRARRHRLHAKGPRCYDHH